MIFIYEWWLKKDHCVEIRLKKSYNYLYFFFQWGGLRFSASFVFFLYINTNRHLDLRPSEFRLQCFQRWKTKFEIVINMKCMSQKFFSQYAFRILFIIVSVLWKYRRFIINCLKIQVQNIYIEKIPEWKTKFLCWSKLCAFFFL